MNIADLRLLHYWTAIAYKDMSVDASRWRLWQIDCVEIALNFPFLLRALLALAAVHKVAQPTRIPQAQRQALLLQADRHISNALETYRRNLEHPREETAIPMFLLSMVLVTYNLASAQLEAPEDPIKAMRNCIGLVQGVTLVIRPHWDQIMNSKIFEAMIEKPPEESEGEVEEVLRLKKLAETKKTSTRDLYTSAIDDLHQSFLKTRQCPVDHDRLVGVQQNNVGG